MAAAWLSLLALSRARVSPDGDWGGSQCARHRDKSDTAMAGRIAGPDRLGDRTSRWCWARGWRGRGHAWAPIISLTRTAGGRFRADSI